MGGFFLLGGGPCVCVPLTTTITAITPPHPLRLLLLSHLRHYAPTLHPPPHFLVSFANTCVLCQLLFLTTTTTTIVALLLLKLQTDA